MKEFLMIFRSAGMGDVEPTPEQTKAVDKQWADWIGRLAEQGVYAGGTHPTMEGLVISANHVITDGPYAEIKEILMGTIIVKAESIESAAEVGKGSPILLIGGSVEVRPVIVHPM